MDTVGPIPGSVKLPRMLFHFPQSAVGLEGSGLRTGIPGIRDIIHIKVVCEGWCQELSHLEMFVEDKKTAQGPGSIKKSQEW